jgi:SH3 domain protein
MVSCWAPQIYGYFKEDVMLLYTRIAIAVFMVFVCNTAVAWSETRYISDQLIVSLRELPQNNSKTIVYLRTDTPVEVIDVGEEYLKVKTANGEIGYIQQSYLTANLPKAIVIKRLTQENESLKERVQELEKRYSEAFSKGDETQKKILADLAESRDQAEKLQRDFQQAQSELAERSKAYETLKENAKDIIAITDERNQLKLSNEELTTTLASLQEERKGQLQKQTVQWFLAGAGVLFLGWILGKFSRSRRKSSLY